MISLLLLVFAFVAGLFTILAPCIWPLLPIILSSSISKTKSKALGTVIGLCISFLIFTLAISFLIQSIGFNADVLRVIATIIIALMGVIMLVSSLYEKLEASVSVLTGKLGFKPTQGSNEFVTGLITGLSLGLVWSPCAGPILATVASLAITSKVTFDVILLALVYVIGIGIPLFILAYFGNIIFSKVKFLSKNLRLIQQIFGVLLIITAVSIYYGYSTLLQAQIANALPEYANFVTGIEQNPAIQNGLQEIKNNTHTINQKIENTGLILPNYGPAPELIGITNWINSKPLTLQNLKGKIVLIDFWTYSCVNCLRTLPYVKEWYSKYKDQGFVIIGVHTPEFEFEKKPENVINAVKQNGIEYPVAQDNDYATWNNYNNQYWPAEYLIDDKGNVRKFHFGEGNYDETDKAIQELILEKGGKMVTTQKSTIDETPSGIITPETYVGYERAQSFNSNEPMKIGLNNYTLPQQLKDNSFAFQGQWTEDLQYAIPQPNSTLELNFYAKKVFLVLTPIKGKEKITILLDDKPISESQAGTDVNNSILTLDNPRLYNLVNLKQSGKHDLKIKFNNSVQVYAFTFG